MYRINILIVLSSWRSLYAPAQVKLDLSRAKTQYTNFAKFYAIEVQIIIVSVVRV